jgi:hypothetical protein
MTVVCRESCLAWYKLIRASDETLFISCRQSDNPLEIDVIHSLSSPLRDSVTKRTHANSREVRIVNSSVNK